MRSSDPQFRFATTFGGRYGHVRGRFIESQLIFSPVNPGGVAMRAAHDQTDTIGGLFVNAQGILLRRHAALGDFQFTVDGEFAHDWINFDGFESRGLATASLMFGFMFTR